MKVALVYDRVTKWGGAERVLLALHEIFPDAPLFTSVYSPKKATWAKVFPQIIPSFLQSLPLVKHKHEYFPFLMPLAFESLNLTGYDLVISITSESAKGVITKGNTIHICYCLTPTRYLWSGYDDYFGTHIHKNLTKPLISYLRAWDLEAAKRPDIMIAISTEVQRRIKKYYGRKSQIIHPPVSVKLFSTKKSKTTNRNASFLLVSRLVPYKKVDLVIEAFNELALPLTIVGVGSEEKKLQRLAKRNIKFTGFVSDRKLHGLYRNSKALIFPQLEDFGIVAVEAHAQGLPVVAYKKGGSIDTVIDGLNGLLFPRQDVKSLLQSIKRFEKTKFNSRMIKHSAQRFSKEKFQKEFKKLIKTL